jgi:hypothetical protein
MRFEPKCAHILSIFVVEANFYVWIRLVGDFYPIDHPQRVWGVIVIDPGSIEFQGKARFVLVMQSIVFTCHENIFETG